MSTDDTATGLAKAFFAERSHWIIRGSSTEPGKAVVVRLDGELADVLAHATARIRARPANSPAKPAASDRAT